MWYGKRTLIKWLHCVVYDIAMLCELFGGTMADSLTFDHTPKPILRLLTNIVKWRIKYDKTYDMNMGIIE